MAHLAPHELLVMFLALAVLLGAARLLGQVAQWMHQPAVLGELLAGVLLGPTVLGTFAPGAFTFLFPTEGPNALALDAIANLAIVLFLLVAGMEVDLSTVWRQGKVAVWVGSVGIFIPFALGMFAAWLGPQMLGREPGADPLIFALFFGTAMSISALPVIIKTLFDLDMYRSDVGMVIVSAAMFNDVLDWTVFAVILGMLIVMAVILFLLFRFLVFRFLIVMSVRGVRRMMMSAFNAQNHGASRKEQQRFEEGMGQQVEHASHIGSHTNSSDHKAKL